MFIACIFIELFCRLNGMVDVRVLTLTHPLVSPCSSFLLDVESDLDDLFLENNLIICVCRLSGILWLQYVFSLNS